MEENNSSDFYAKSKFVKELTDKDFDSTKPYILKNKDCSAVLFYCAWCGHCQRFKDTWNQLGKNAAFYNVCAVNCEKNKRLIEKIKNDMKDLIQGYPTIVFYRNGEPAEHYDGEREFKPLLNKFMSVCK